MAQTFEFPGRVTLPRRPHRKQRPLGNLFQEIAARSPSDIADFRRLAMIVLARLNEDDQWGSWPRTTRP